MINTLRQTIQKYNMLSNGDGVIVALSGGADSTALLESFGFTAEEIRGEEYDGSIKPVIGPADYDYSVYYGTS